MAATSRRRSLSPPANRRQRGSPPANNGRSCSPPATASSPYFLPDLIPEVARRLTNLQDFFALRAACRSYRARLPLTPSNLASQAPLLLVPVENTESHALFHPTLRRIHRFRFHRAPFAAGDESALTDFHSLGCRLAVQDFRERSEGQPTRRNLSIVKILTGERTCLASPPEPFTRVLLYDDLVLTWNHYGRTIHYCRLEAAHWSVASIIEPYKLHSLFCVNGVLHALVTPGYILAVVKLSESKNLVELLLLGGNLDASVVRMHEKFIPLPQLHLAECCGELILISTMEFDPRIYHVFKWKFGEAKWERMTSLGGCTLFLADDRFVGCLGPDHKGIRGDSIYITEDTAGDWCEYSLDDESFNRFVAEYPGGAVPLDICTLTWVLPSMF